MHDLTGLCIQCAERLIHQQKVRPRHQRPGNRDTLLHAAGQLAGVGAGKVLQAHQIEQRIGAATGGFHVRLAVYRVGDHLQLTAELDVLGHRQPGVEAVVLEHHGAVNAGAVNRLAAQQEVAAAVGFQPGHDAQQGRLAAAGGANKGDELVRLYLKVNVTQRLDGLVAGSKLLAHVADADAGLVHGLTSSASGRRGDRASGTPGRSTDR